MPNQYEKIGNMLLLSILYIKPVMFLNGLNALGFSGYMKQK